MSRAYSLEELARLPEFYHPVASPAGDRVALYYDRTGRNELYLLDPGSGELEQVSDGNVPRNARHGIAWGADGERVYFHADEGGDEQNDIHEIDLGGETRPVVTAEGQCVLQDVDPDGRFLLYASSEGDQLNLYAHDLDSGVSEQLTDYDRPVFGGGYSPDGERVAYTTNESEDMENRDVYLANADGSDARNLRIGEEGAATSFVDWSPDGSRLLVSDDSEDKTRAGVYDLETDAVEWYGDGEHEEYPRAVLPDGAGFLALRVREAAFVPVRYGLDGTARELTLAEGVASFPSGGRDPAFLDDGSVLVAHTTSARRDDLLRYDLDSDEKTPLLEADYGDVDPDAFVDSEYVTYESTAVDERNSSARGTESHGGLEIGGLLYDSGERPSPAVVMVHGGPHAQSTKRFNRYAQFLVSQGYTVLEPNYRGSTGRGREFRNAIHGDWGGMEAEDVAEAGRWLKEREWIDEDRVATFGGSYGGYSTYVQLTKHPKLWTTGIAWIGITDLHALYEESMPHFKTTLEEQLGDPDENADLWRERSPIEHVDEMERSILITHGVNDPRCPVSQARRFRDALEHRGWTEGKDGDFEYHEFGEEGHGSTDIDQKIRVFRIMADYLDRRL